MEIPLPANVVNLENLLDLGAWAWRRALAPTGNDKKPELLALAPAGLLGLVPHQPPLTYSSHS